MFRLRSTLITLIISDSCALLVSFVLAYLARFVTGGDLPFSVYAGLLPGYILFLLLYTALGLYPGVLTPPQEELKRLSIGTSTGFLFLSFFFFMGQQGIVYSRGFMVLCWLLSLLLLPLFRYGSRRFFARRKWWGYPVLLFAQRGKSAGPSHDFFVHPERGLFIAETFVLGEPGEDGETAVSLSDDARLEETLVNIKKRHPSAIAFLITESIPSSKKGDIILRLCRYFRRVIVEPEEVWSKQATLRVADVPSGLVLTMRQNLLDPNRMRMKRLLDISFCLLGSVALAILIPLLALCIRLESRGPVFFRQKRIGQGGKTIEVYKFRTMVENAEEVLTRVLENNPQMKAEWEADQKLTNDPRLTRFGAFLRHTSLDELPQIFNVLKNEMSLVGPRPIVENEIGRYGEAYELYKRVKPGITGLWQVSGRSNIEYARRIELDRRYVYNWSVWLDIYIIIRTIPAMLTGKGAY